MRLIRATVRAVLCGLGLHRRHMVELCTSLEPAMRARVCLRCGDWTELER